MEMISHLHALAALTLKKKPLAPIGGWIRFTAGPHILEKEKISCPYQKTNTELSSPQPNHCTDYTIQLLTDHYWSKTARARAHTHKHTHMSKVK